MGNDDFYQFLFDVYTNLLAVAEDGAGIYVFHADTEGVNFRKALVDVGFKLSQCCVWVKQTMVCGRARVPWEDRPHPVRLEAHGRTQLVLRQNADHRLELRSSDEERRTS